MSSRNEPSGFQIDQIVENEFLIFRLAVGREPHHLVFAGVDLEAGVIGAAPNTAGRANAGNGSPGTSPGVLPSPIAAEVVAHSPTPSMVSTAAFSNGEG